MGVAQHRHGPCVEFFITAQSFILTFNQFCLFCLTSRYLRVMEKKEMQKLLAIFALTVGISAMPLSASAHGPSPQKIEKSIVIKAEPAKVWAMVKDFGGIQKWHPAVASTKVEKKGEDTLRFLTLKSGGTVLEKLRSADDASMKLKYEIVETTLPVADFNAVISVAAGANANETVVTWTGRCYRVYKLNPPIPEGQDDKSAADAVTNIIDAGLTNLKKVIEAAK